MKLVKAIVWDLDHTLWSGILLEGDVVLKTDMVDLIRAADSKGILNLIASRSDSQLALGKLEELGIRELFVLCEIGWAKKSAAITRFIGCLNIGIDAVIFVDDDQFEREEVRSAHPGIEVIDPLNVAEMERLKREVEQVETSAQSAMRKGQILQAACRDAAEKSHVGPAIGFLRSLRLTLAFRRCGGDDLDRVRELALRTNQLNLTGTVYSVEELLSFASARDTFIVIAELTDRYGSYGGVASALLSFKEGIYQIESMFVSCRVMSRGVTGVILSVMARHAGAAGARLRVRFVDTGRNEPMLASLKFWGFSPDPVQAGVMACDTSAVPPVPDYYKITMDASVEEFFQSGRSGAFAEKANLS